MALVLQLEQSNMNSSNGIPEPVWSVIEHSSLLVQLRPAEVELDEDKDESKLEGDVA
jgi:hypothetical protein